MSNFCQLVVQQTSQKKKKGVGPFLNPGEFQQQTVPVIPAPKRLSSFPSQGNSMLPLLKHPDLLLEENS